MKKFAVQARNHLNFIIFLVSLLIIIVILWGPIGLHNSPNDGEQWLLIQKVQRGQDLIPAKDWPTRPLRWIPYAIGYHLAPDSLIGINIFLIILFALRGLITYWLFSQLFPDKPDIVLTTTLAFILYPVGRGFFGMNTVNLQTALVLGLIAIGVILTYWRTNQTWRWIIILSTQISSLLIYALYYLVFGITPILFWWIDKRVEFSRRFIRTTAIWYVACLILGIRFLSIVFGNSNDYVTHMLNTNLEQESLLDAASYAIPRLYFDHLIAWVRALSQLDINKSYFEATLLGGFLVGIVVLLRQPDKEPQIPAKLSRAQDYILSIAYALLFIFTAFFIYIPIFKVFGTWRTYFVASLGAAFLTALSLHFLLQLKLPFKKIIYSVVIALMVVMGTNYHLVTLQSIAGDTALEKELIANIVENVPATKHTILVVDNNGIYPGILFLAGGLAMSLEYVYDQPTDAWLCRTNPLSPVYCEFSDDQVFVTVKNWSKQYAYDYDDIIIFYTLDDDSIYLVKDMKYLTDKAHPEYQPENLIKDVPYPQRAYSFFDCFPSSECGFSTQPTEHLRLDFDEPVTGLGFRASGNSQQWMQRSYALLEYPIIPNQDYLITFSVDSLDERIYEGIHVTVNDQPIYLVQQGSGHGRIIAGFISPDIINESPAQIEFNVDNVPTSETGENLALLFDWLTIEPFTETKLYPTTEFHLDFDEPVWGENWSPPSPTSRAWTLGQRSTLYLPLVTNQAYSLEFAVTTYKPEILDGVSIQINDLAITLERENQDGMTIFRGTIPVGILNTHNWLEIMTEDTFTPLEVGLGNDTRELGLFFDWLEIKPITD